MKKEGTNENITSLSEFNYSEINATYLSFPHVVNIDGEINIESIQQIRYLQLGTLNNPVIWTNPKLKVYQFVSLNLTIFTEGAIPFKIEIVPESAASKVQINFKDSEVE